MQENTEKTRSSTQSGGQFIDTLIGQWMKRTGTDIALHQAEEQVVEASTSQESKPLSPNQERNIQILLRKLKQSQREEISLSSILEMEMRYKEEIQTKLNTTWESIDTITDYCNYISESLASFQQHRVNLSNLYDNVILKQQGHIQKLQSSNIQLKDLEKRFTELENEVVLREKRLQESIIEQNQLRKQLEDSVHELQTQKNELAHAHAEEKILVKEQQRLLLEYENLQLRLQTIENEKCDIAKSTAQLQNKLVLQEEKMQTVLTEKDKLYKQLENANSEFYAQKNKLASVHAEEERKFVEEQQRLLTECESLQSQLNILQHDKSNISELVAQKDRLISKLLNENSMYKNKIEVITANNNEACNKYKALEEKQNIWEKELRTKTERIQNLEAALSATKQRETSLVNDVNRMEKKLTNEINYSKNLESKLSDTKKNLQNAEMQNAKMQEMQEHDKTANEFVNNELANVNQKLKILQQEKEEAEKREIMQAKNADILYENIQAKHAEEVSTLTSSYDTRILELRKTIDCLNEANKNTMQENSALKISLTEITKENISLKNDYQSSIECNKNLHDKLKESVETLRIKSIDTQEPKRSYLKDKTQSKEKGAYKASTFAGFRSRISDLGDNDRSLSQQLNHTYSIKRESPKEQEEEVTSSKKKFFKLRPTQPRTYSKRR
ncbi:interaptin-like isoform X2 [Odontomachus brunneus]|uniref:interaptin-like isoform X2 n=1 Tax=Odontomachus brunneus TaxID=486640 RepID=UPI0013F1C1C1|nr:interaptin-like isoform X2 [Odontomachus brunneus]